MRRGAEVSPGFDGGLCGEPSQGRGEPPRFDTGTLSSGKRWADQGGKKAGKKYIIGDTGAGYAGKMLSMAAKKFGLKCKIFMGAKDIKRQQPNVRAIRGNGAEIIPVYTGSQTLVDAVSECMRFWVANCDTTAMCVGSTVGPTVEPTHI